MNIYLVEKKSMDNHVDGSFISFICVANSVASAIELHPFEEPIKNIHLRKYKFDRQLQCWRKYNYVSEKYDEIFDWIGFPNLVVKKLGKADTKTIRIIMFKR